MVFYIFYLIFCVFVCIIYHVHDFLIGKIITFITILLLVYLYHFTHMYFLHIAENHQEILGNHRKNTGKPLILMSGTALQVTKFWEITNKKKMNLVTLI